MRDRLQCNCENAYKKIIYKKFKKELMQYKDRICKNVLRGEWKKKKKQGERRMASNNRKNSTIEKKAHK